MHLIPGCDLNHDEFGDFDFVELEIECLKLDEQAVVMKLCGVLFSGLKNFFFEEIKVHSLILSANDCHGNRYRQWGLKKA